MSSDADRALWSLEETVEGVLSFVKAAAYGLRLATKRIGDLAAGGHGAGSEEMETLVEALRTGDDHLSEVAVLALGDHFRAFLAAALELPQAPPLPSTPREIEELAGTPGALERIPFWFPLLLQLYRAALRGGPLDRAALDAMGVAHVELAHPGGKVKMYREGDRVPLSEHQIHEAAETLLEAARAVRLRIITA